MGRGEGFAVTIDERNTAIHIPNNRANLSSLTNISGLYDNRLKRKKALAILMGLRFNAASPRIGDTLRTGSSAG